MTHLTVDAGLSADNGPPSVIADGGVFSRPAMDYLEIMVMENGLV
jgi:hypothetical protein